MTPATRPTGETVEPEMYIIDSKRAALNVTAFRELWAFREVLWAFILRRLKTRYRHSIFGVGWVILQPLAFAAVFAVFLGRLAGITSGGVPYFLFALSGLGLWTYFSSTVTSAIESILAEAAVMRKVYFPREIPPISAAAACFVDVVVALAVLLIFTVGYGHTPTKLWILIPLPLAIVAISSLGVGLILAGFNVYYRDVAYGLPFLIQMGFFASPIIYPISIIPAHIRALYEVLNPVAACIESMRDILFYKQMPNLGLLGLSAVPSIAVLVAGYAIFKRLERRFTDSA